MPRKLVARSRHRKDGAPGKLVAQQGGQSTGKMMRLGKERWCA